MSADNNHAETSPDCTHMMLNISEPLKVFTTGDTIYGHLIFDTRRHVKLVKSSVCLTCVETCKLEGVEQKQITHYSQEIDILTSEPTITTDLESSRGEHVIPFKFPLGDDTLGVPPTVSLDDMGDPQSGIKWTMKACINFGTRTGCFYRSKFLEDSLLLSVHPMVPHEEEKFAEVLQSILRRDHIQTISANNIPLYLPRSPETFSIDVVVDSAFPIYVLAVSAILKTIVYIRPFITEDTQMITLTSSILLDKLSCSNYYLGRVHLDGFLHNCSLDHCGPSRFRSLCV